MQSLAFINNIFGIDGLVVLIIGLLIFGRRLPEVGRNLGQTIVEFKKGLNGKSDDEAPALPEDRPAPKRIENRATVRATPKSLPSTEEV